MGAPHLAGQRAAYLVKQLHDFRSQERRHKTLNAMAEVRSDADIANIGAYFASQLRMTWGPTPENGAARDLFLYGAMERSVDPCVNGHEKARWWSISTRRPTRAAVTSRRTASR